MNHSFAANQSAVAPTYMGYTKSSNLNAGPRLLNNLERSRAKGLACFPEHAQTVVDALAPYEGTHRLDVELNEILAKARKTLAFKSKMAALRTH